MPPARRFLELGPGGTAFVVVPASEAHRMAPGLVRLVRQAQQRGPLAHGLAELAFAFDGAARHHEAWGSALGTAEVPLLDDGGTDPGESPRRITTAEAARLLHCSERNITKRAASGSLPGLQERPGAPWTFDAAELQPFIDAAERRHGQAPEAA